MAYKLHMKIYNYESWAIFKSEPMCRAFFESVKNQSGVSYISMSNLDTNTLLIEHDRKEWDEDWNHNER